MTAVSFDQLTAEQQSIADHPARTVLVLGGAGVGKTTTALWAARRELLDHGCGHRPVPGRRVLFVTFSRTGAAGLSAALTESSVDHTPIGFGEAYGESLSAMVTMMAFSQGLRPWEEVGSALAVALTASVRSREPPSLAVALSDGAALPAMLQRRVEKLRADLDNAGDDVIRLAELSAGAWEALGIASGRRAWSRAGRSLVSLTARYASNAAEAIERLAVSVADLRNESFVELDSGDTGAIQLMNFHQTKGREADAVVLSYGSADYYGRGGEPYDEPSRVLYVSMTRAREKVIVLLPPSPHPLVEPFERYAVPR